MNLEVWRLAIDFALFVLIWMVQLLIYPGFSHFESAGLARWHRIYTRNMTFIVAPLMIAQLGIAGYFFYAFPAMFATNVIYMTLTAACWITTFIIFIPLHNRIDATPHDRTISVKLTKLNWIRVVLWSLILALDFVLLY
ncbi:MAG: hypothetical protein NWQ09_00900 [Nonlabens sp.]|jgi:hypothetical protein|nr:hypothetical protein [Nonlabens sp.]MDP5099857.1 hypothetical protein [Nonlabens sp.]